jgi:hypothetical protein
MNNDFHGFGDLGLFLVAHRFDAAAAANRGARF